MARWLGVDITTTAVRLVLLASGYRRPTLVALREEQLHLHETPSAALRTAMMGLRAEAVATALPGSSGFVRLLSLPATARKELGNVLGFEVEATLPLELDDAVMDHRLLPSLSGTDQPNTVPILAGVVPTERVRERIGLVLRGTGIEPQRVGLGALPLSNLVQIAPQLGRKDQVAVLDLDDDHTDLVVLRRGRSRFVRSLSHGVHGLPAGAGALALALRQTVAAWRMTGGAPLDELIVVGSGRQTPGLEHFMQHEIGVRIVDLPDLELDGLDAAGTQDLPRFAKALGIALSLGRATSDLNLRQGPVQAQQSYQFLRDKTPLLAGLAAALVVSYGFSTFAEVRALGATRDRLERQLEVATQSNFGKSTRDPEEASKLLTQAISGKFDDPAPAMDAFGVMVELSERIPEDITHDIADLDFNRGAVVLKGIVPTIDNAHTISSDLAKQTCFHDVNITRTTQLSNRDKQKYTLELTVDCAATPKGGKSSKGSKGSKGGKGSKGSKGSKGGK